MSITIVWNVMECCIVQREKDFEEAIDSFVYFPESWKANNWWINWFLKNLLSYYFFLHFKIRNNDNVLFVLQEAVYRFRGYVILKKKREGLAKYSLNYIFIMRNQCRLYSYFKRKKRFENSDILMESLLNCASVSVTKNSTASQGIVGHRRVDRRIWVHPLHRRDQSADISACTNFGIARLSKRNKPTFSKALKSKQAEEKNPTPPFLFCSSLWLVTFVMRTVSLSKSR